MVDQGFDDFLDSDDDEFLLEASNHFLDNDLNFECTSTRKESVLQNPSKISFSNYFEPETVFSPNKQSTIEINKESTNPQQNVVKNSCEVVSSSSSNHHDNELLNGNDEVISFNISVISSKNEISNISETNSLKRVNKNKAVTTISSDCNNSENVHSFKIVNSSNASCVSNCVTLDFTPKPNDEAIATTSSNFNISAENGNSLEVATPTNSSYINSRFTPGFTPKAKKRKFLGPAGFLEFFDGSKNSTVDNSDKMLSMDVEFQNIVSSQYSPEHLSLPSWQKLQTTVSSCSNLLSTAKYYSIQRVLSESSKKKLPKHMVVPVLCVLLKKLSTKGSSVISIFMDDTGEIKGKIDADVLSKYKELLVEGTALILKKVTFLCNVLILKDENLVSLYHPQGTEKHPQSLEYVLETSEPLKPMNCECLKLSHAKKDSLKTSHYDTSKCVTHSQNRLNSISYQSKGKNLPSKNNSTPKNNSTLKSGFVNPAQNRTPCIINQNNSIIKNVDEVSVNSQNMKNDEFLELLLDEDNCMDEFDEILGNLDEKSFMDDV